MNDLRKFFDNNDDGKLIHKWMHYFDIYDRYFSRYRHTGVHILEIGVSQGGSLQMWKEYFGDQAKIYGVDVNPECKQLEEDQVQIFIGDQGDTGFLQQIRAQIPRIDILIDDGGHTMAQQIATFEQLYPAIDDHGVYLCEDTHTSYWAKFGGGHQRSGTFIEYAKKFIDGINAWHSKETSLQVNNFTRSTYAAHFYDSIVVLEKKPMIQPEHKRSGQKTVQAQHKPIGFWKRLERRLTGKIAN